MSMTSTHDRNPAAHSSDAPPPSPFFISGLIPRGLGVLLLIAAALKMYGLGVDPVARTGMLSAPAFQFFLVLFELVLGAWLISGRQPAGAWLTVLIAFVAFACVSFYQGWIGLASCGCFGRVAVNPWVTFTVDVVAIVALLITRPDLQPLWDNRAAVARTGSVVGGGYLLILGGLALVAHFRHGSIDVALANLRNERLSVYPATLDMGEGTAGKTVESHLELSNRTDHPIRVIGGTSDCSCTVLGDLPVKIPPHDSRSIIVQVHLPRKPGLFTREAQLVIDDEGFKRVGFRLTGRIHVNAE